MVSKRALWITMVGLTVIGLAVASYLTYVHYAGIKPACTAGESCTKVQTSVYSHLAGVPVALLGLIAPESETTRFATAAVTTVGLGFSAYLTYRELFSIHAICEWCVSSAVIMALLLCLAVWRFLQGDSLTGSRRATTGDDAGASFDPQPS
jgi:uncharacterized membrane protein